MHTREHDTLFDLQLTEYLVHDPGGEENLRVREALLANSRRFGGIKTLPMELLDRIGVRNDNPQLSQIDSLASYVWFLYGIDAKECEELAQVITEFD